MDKPQRPRGLFVNTREFTRRRDAEREERASQQAVMLKLLQQHSGINCDYLLTFLVNEKRPLQDLVKEMDNFYEDAANELEADDETVTMVDLAKYIIEIQDVIKSLIRLEEGSVEGAIYKKETEAIIRSNEELWKPVKKALLLLLETYTPHIDVSSVDDSQTKVSAQKTTNPSIGSPRGIVISLDAARRRKNQGGG